MTAQEI